MVLMVRENTLKRASPVIFSLFLYFTASSAQSNAVAIRTANRTQQRRHRYIRLILLKTVIVAQS